MASFGHIAVGMAAGRWEVSRTRPLLTSAFASQVLYAGLSLLPLFAPITPLPVAPLGRHLLSGRGLTVMLTELICFAPLVLYALWPRRDGQPQERT